MRDTSIKVLILVMFCGWCKVSGAENRIDTQRPDAPQLAAYGNYPIGIRTFEIINPSQLDILQIDPAAAKPETLPRYDRALTIELWYPAAPASKGRTTFDVFLRDGKTQVALHGKATRDASPFKSKQAFPLVLISHGYPGNRFLLSHLAENIASKGYVVASIDHTDSTYRTKAAFGSTLVNRSLDQKFTLSQIDKMSKNNDSFLYKTVDASNTALIGYSMGGYGALISAGAGVTQQAVDYAWGAPHGTLAVHKSGTSSHNALIDPRIKTIVAFAPWGMNFGFWDTASLKGVKIPALFVAGSVDDVSGYENGIQAIWQQTTGVERALLTFENANHSSGAPMPAPEESYVFDQQLGIHLSDHYTDPVWDSVRMNNISQHFVTAWLGKYLKQDSTMQQFLNLVPNSNDGIWAKEKDGSIKSTHNHWTGFANRTAKGLRFETLAAGK